MAAKTPAASNGTGGVDRQRGLYTGTIVAANDLQTDGTVVNTRQNFILEIYYFADIDDDDTWASGILGIQAVAWQADEGQDVADACSASLDTVNGSIRFKTATAGNALGWLWVFIDPSVGRRSGTPVR